MRTAPTPKFEDNRSFLLGVGRVLWNVIRLPIMAVLLLLEPVVRFVCSAGFILGILTCIVWELSVAGPRFPLAKVLTISLSFPVILFLYYGLLSLFIRD